VPAAFDLPAFYRRAGLAVLGPFAPAAPRAKWLPAVHAMTCVGLCRALLGPEAPRAMTPYGLFRALGGRVEEINRRTRKNVLTAG
jgi:hypothetical protein